MIMSAIFFESESTRRALRTRCRKEMFANVAAPPVPVAEVEPERQESAFQKAIIEKGLAETTVERIRVDGLVSFYAGS